MRNFRVGIATISCGLGHATLTEIETVSIKTNILRPVIRIEVTASGKT